jgi:hypothetical protein
VNANDFAKVTVRVLRLITLAVPIARADEQMA